MYSKFCLVCRSFAPAIFFDCSNCFACECFNASNRSSRCSSRRFCVSRCCASFSEIRLSRSAFLFDLDLRGRRTVCLPVTFRCCQAQPSLSTQPQARVAMTRLWPPKHSSQVPLLTGISTVDAVEVSRPTALFAVSRTFSQLLRTPPQSRPTAKRAGNQQLAAGGVGSSQRGQQPAGRGSYGLFVLLPFARG
jgi:hypothetical protein